MKKSIVSGLCVTAAIAMLFVGCSGKSAAGKAET